MRTMSERIRCYTDLMQIDSFIERYRYLRIGGELGHATFGYDRYLNQRFYHSSEWKSVRNTVIARDNGCDLGSPGYEIHDRLYVHHMNPMTVEGLISDPEAMLDTNYLITTTHSTHNAIHYGTEELLPREPVLRMPGDTKLW